MPGYFPNDDPVFALQNTVNTKRSLRLLLSSRGQISAFLLFLIDFEKVSYQNVLFSPSRSTQKDLIRPKASYMSVRNALNLRWPVDSLQFYRDSTENF